MIESVVRLTYHAATLKSGFQKFLPAPSLQAFELQPAHSGAMRIHMPMRVDEQTIETMAPTPARQGGELWRLTLSRKFMLVFAALGLVGLGNWLVVESTLSHLRGSTTQVNIVGSIRWISQRVQADIMRMAYGKGERSSVEAQIDRLDEVIKVLGQGGEHLGLVVREPSEIVSASIEPLRLAVQEYRRDVALALDRLAERRSIADQLDELQEDGNYLLSTADSIAAALSVQIAGIEKQAARNLYLLAMADLAILLAALAVFRLQVLRPLHLLSESSRRFARGSYSERVGIETDDEIGDLGRAFDRMAGDIERDISRIARDRDALQVAQHGLRKLSRAVEHSPASVVITDTMGRIEYVNPKFTEITGYAGEETIGRDIGFMKSGDTPRAVYEDMWRAITSGREWRGELMNRKKSGELFREDTRISPLSDEQGRTTHFISIKEDVTERQRAAEELRVSKELFQATFDSAAVGLILYDLTGRFLLANNALCETLGYSQEVLLHKTLQEITHPDDLGAAIALEQKVLVGELVRSQLEMRCYHRDGRIVWAVLSVAMVRDKAHAPLYYIGQIVDISSRKAMEQELIESRTRLRELAAYRDAVREEERKRIALEIHDELGQLLTALKMDISLLRMQHESDDRIGRKTAEMRELIERTIGVVRQVATNLRPAALNLGIVPALEWLVEEFGQRTGIAYELNHSGGEIVLDDQHSTAVFRIVQESLTNVMRHASAACVSVSLKHQEEALLLEIRDDGRGFDLEAAKRGPSFGLLGIRERALVLGGTLTIDTGEGCGTTLTIRIPCTREGAT